MSNTAPPGVFKMTENGYIPEDWQFVPLESVASEGLKDGTHNPPKRFATGVPLLSARNIKLGYVDWEEDYTYITEEDYDHLSKSIRIEPGDILLTIVGTIGRSCICPSDRVFSLQRSVAIVKPRRDLIFPAFLMFYFNSHRFRKELMSKAIGSAQKGVYLNKLRSLQIPLPKLAEQRKIAAVLSTVWEAKEKTQAVIGAAKALKKSLMKRLFTHGSVSISDAGDLALKETEVGAIPEKWSIVKLSDVATIERGKFAHRPRNDPDYYGGSIPFIQTGDIANAEVYVRGCSQTLNERGLSISRVFPKNTLVITIAANIGDVAMLGFDCAFPDSVIGITPGSKIDSLFLLYYLKTQREKMNALAPRGTQKNINIQFLRPWPVPLPPLSEQKAIAESILCVDEKVEAEQDRLRGLSEVFQALLGDLVTGRLRVINLEAPT
jgi:type I restriction enzyme S subunit